MQIVIALTDEAKKFLKRKGVGDDLIKKYKIGFGKFYGTAWITIPTYNVDSEIQYIKLLHYPGDAPNDFGESSRKYATFPQEHKPTIFNERTLFGKDECVIVGSEPDAIVASQYLEIPVIGIPEIDTLKNRATGAFSRQGYYLYLD